MTDRADRSFGLGEGEPGADRNEGGLIGVDDLGTHVGDGELHVFAEAVRGRAEAAPVVDC